MKTWRILYQFCLWLSLLAGLATANRLFYVFFAVLFLLGFFSFLINVLSAMSFTYLQTVSAEQTIRGRSVGYRLSIHNETPFPYALLNLHLSTPDRLNKKDLVFNLQPHAHQDFQFNLDCPYRGVYHIGMTTIDFIDLFGLLRFPFDMRLLPYYRLCRLMVYPQLFEMIRLPLKQTDQSASARKPYATEDQSEPVSMVRAYQMGDTMKRIHWKLSARHHQLLTRQYDQQTEQDILILVDLLKGPDDWTTWQTEDMICSCLASLVYNLLKANQTVHIQTFGKEINDQKIISSAHFQPFYRRLVDLAFDRLEARPINYPILLSQGRLHQSVYYLGSTVNEAAIQALTDMKNHQIPVFCFLVGPTDEHSRQMANGIQYLQQTNIPHCPIRYGESLAEKLDTLGYTSPGL